MAATIRSIIGGDVPGIRDGLASTAHKTFKDNLDALPIHLQLSADEVEVYGGFVTPQLINTVAFEADVLDWLLRELSRLDEVIDLDFYFQADSDGTLLDVYLDTEINLEDGIALGLATPNLFTSSSDDSVEYRWWEVFLNTPELISNPSQLRYALIHEIGHSLGLEHPFEDNDGDVWGSIFSWPRGDETVMSYTQPDGDWPTTFSPLDFAALASLWSLEVDHDAGWEFRDPDGSEAGPLSTELADSRLAQEKPNEQLIGPASGPAEPQPIFAPVQASLLQADINSSPSAIQSQGSGLVYYGFSESAHGDPHFVLESRATLQELDHLLELDFVELDNLDSPLLQLLISRDSSSGYSRDDGLLWLEHDVVVSDLSQSSVFAPSTHTLNIDTLNPYYRNLDLFDSRNDYLNYVLLHGLALSMGLVNPWSNTSLLATDFSVGDTVMAVHASDVVGDMPLSPLDRGLLLDRYGTETTHWTEDNIKLTPQLSLLPSVILLDQEGCIDAVQTVTQRSENSAPDVSVQLLRLLSLDDTDSPFYKSTTQYLPSGSNRYVTTDDLLPEPVSSLRYRLTSPSQALVSPSASEFEIIAPTLWAGSEPPSPSLRVPGEAIPLEAVLPGTTSSDAPSVFSVHYNAQAFSPSIPSALASSAVVVADSDDLDLDSNTSHRLVISSSESQSAANSPLVSPGSIGFVATSNRFDPVTGLELSSPFRISYYDPDLSSHVAFAGVQLTTFDLDVDGDGRATALGDGLMIVRKLFGSAFSGDALTTRARSSTATRTNAEIHAFIQHGIDSLELDVDGDGRVTALGDGLMIVRSLFGSAFSGTSLIRRAISPSSPLLVADDPSSREQAAKAVGAAIDDLTPLHI